MPINSTKMLKKILEQKNWTISDLTREYAKLEEPDLPANDAIIKYGSMIRKAVNDPDHTKHGTVKKLIEILGGELIVRHKVTEELFM